MSDGGFVSRLIDDGAAEWHMRARVATGWCPPPPPPRNSLANCVHRMRGIEARFQRVAQRNTKKHAGRGPHLPMAYVTATLRSMEQSVSLPLCWRKAGEALR